MPKIPVGQEQQRLNPSSPVSIADTNDARMQGTATARLGESIGQFGQQLGKLQEAERDIEFSKQKNVLEAESMVALEEAKVSGEKDLPKAYQKNYQARVAKVMGGAPKDDDVLYSRMTDFADQAQQIGQRYAEVEQLKVGEQSVLNKFTEAKNSHLNVVRTNPSDLSARFKAFDAEVLQPAANVTGIDGKRRSDLDLAARADFGYAAVDGYIEKKQFGAALRLLNAQTSGTVEVDGVQVPLEMNDTKGKPLSEEEVSIMSALPADQKDKLRDRIRIKGETEATMRLSDITGRMGDIRASIENGIPVSDKNFKMIESQIAGLRVPETAKVIMKDTLRSMSISAMYSSKMKDATPEQMVKILNEAHDYSVRGKPGDPVFNMERRQQDFQLVRKAYERAIQMRGKDGAGAALESSPDLQQMKKATLDGNQDATVKYADALLGEQKRLGIAQPQILTQAESLDSNQRLKAASSPEMLVAQVEGMQAKYGRHSQQAIMEATKNDTDLKIMAFAYDPETKKRFAENILNKKSIEEDLKRKDTNTASLIRTGARALANGAMIPYEQVLKTAYPQGDAGGLLSAMQGQIETEALKQMVNSGEPKNAAKVLTDSFSVVSRGNQSTIVPKQINGQLVDQKLVGAFMTQTVTEQGLEKLGIAGNPADNPEQAQQRRRNQSEGAKWIPTPDLDGLILMVNINGKPSMAMDKNKRPIFVPLQDIEKRSQQLGIRDIEMSGTWF